MLVLLYDSLILVASGVNLLTVVKQKLRRKEVEIFALQQFDCVERMMHRCSVLLKDEIVINDVIIASIGLTFVEKLKYPRQYCLSIDFHTSLLLPTYFVTFQNSSG